jgi:hypothetical protein
MDGIIVRSNLSIVTFVDFASQLHFDVRAYLHFEIEFRFRYALLHERFEFGDARCDALVHLLIQPFKYGGWQRVDANATVECQW